MTIGDLDAVTELDRRAFGDAAWSRRHFEGEILESPISIFGVLCQEDCVVGYFGTWHVVDQLHLCTFAIDPDAQRRGLGALLLEAVIRLAQRLACVEIQLEVRVSNEPARKLYGGRGFVEQGVRRNLYSHPQEDGILMGLETPGTVQPALALRLIWDDRGGQSEEVWT